MQTQTQEELLGIRKFLQNWKIDKERGLESEIHLLYASWVMNKLGDKVIHFQNAQPWLHFYVAHISNLLNQPLSPEDSKRMQKALKYCGNEGFCGGYGQLDHLAPTYAGFLAILQLGPSAYHLINREGLYSLLCKLKKGGRFMMHEEGECDLRASFIAALLVKSLKLPEDVLSDVPQTIIASQTHEGGISNVIGGQAHGGFTFCGVAALALMGRLQDVDVSRLMDWMSQRQVQFGGFNGRTNKLIDSCYSFWVGAVFNIVNNYFEGQISHENHLLFSEKDLQQYVLFYCQDFQKGGLWDKPGKSRDIYHTCYALSGLASSQELSGIINKVVLEPIDPIYNITVKASVQAKEWFGTLLPL